MRRVAVIGNAGGGKTTLARAIGDALDLPVHHVDSIQYRPGWERAPAGECDRRLDAIAGTDRWVIDGFGGDEAIARRLRAADAVVYVDFPLPVHYWWACKRQWRSRRGQREELPDNCPEFTLAYTMKLARVMWRVHQDYRPWFEALVRGLPETTEVLHIRTPGQWRAFVGGLAA